MSDLFVTPWSEAHKAPLCLCDFPGKNAGVGCHFLLGIFQTQGSNLCPCLSRQILYHLSHRRAKIVPLFPFSLGNALVSALGCGANPGHCQCLLVVFCILLLPCWGDGEHFLIHRLMGGITAVGIQAEKRLAKLGWDSPSVLTLPDHVAEKLGDPRMLLLLFSWPIWQGLWWIRV